MVPTTTRRCRSKAISDLVIGLAPAINDDVRMLVGELDQGLSQSYTPGQRHGLKAGDIFQLHIRFFMARLRGAPVGCGGVALYPDYAEVKRMFVRKGQRGQGIGQALLDRVEAEARAEGRTVLRLKTGTEQHASIRLYERHGFRPCGPFGMFETMQPEAMATSLYYKKPLPPC